MGRGGPDRRGEAWVWEGEVYRGVMDPSEARSLEELLALYGGSLEEALQGLVKRPCSPVSRQATFQGTPQGPWAWIPLALEGGGVFLTPR